MSKILFAPFGSSAGSRRDHRQEGLRSSVGLVDDQEALHPEHCNIAWKKLVSALLLKAAIFRAVRRVVDRGSRQAFRRLTGNWPGEDRPEPA